MNLEDIQNGRLKINSILKLGDEIRNATPLLLDLDKNLEWCGKVYTNLEEHQSLLNNILWLPLENLNSLDNGNFNLSFATGSSATFSTAFNETKEIIKQSTPTYQFLLREFEEINPIGKVIARILNVIGKIDPILQTEFEEVSKSYNEWEAGARTNSDLAKDARTFQEHFNGYLNKLRVPKKDWETVKIPSKSWKKMVDEISKNGTANKNAFMKQQKIGEDIWDNLTPILKKTKEVTKNDLENLFTTFVEHIFSVINLIDETKY